MTPVRPYGRVDEGVAVGGVGAYVPWRSRGVVAALLLNTTPPWRFGTLEGVSIIDSSTKTHHTQHCCFFVRRECRGRGEGEEVRGPAPKCAHTQNNFWSPSVTVSASARSAACTR